MNVDGKSDEPIVPATSANKGSADVPAESSEGSGSTERNAGQAALSRTQSRNESKSRGLNGVREAARKDSTLKFTALLHHVDEARLTRAFFSLKKGAAVGVDGVSWHDYEHDVEANIADLHARIHRGGYRALPSRRVWIPKPDGRQRPLGIAALEDKIVHRWRGSSRVPRGGAVQGGLKRSSQHLSIEVTRCNSEDEGSQIACGCRAST